MITTPSQKRLVRLQRIRLIGFSLILLGACYIVFSIPNLLLSLLLAFVINSMLSPLVNWGERHGLNRSHSTILVFLVFFATMLFLFYTLSPFVEEQLTTLQEELPVYISKFSELIASAEIYLENLTSFFVSINLSTRVNNTLADWGTKLFKDFPIILSNSLTTLFLAPFISFFALKEEGRLSRKILHLVPNSIFEICLSLHHQINEQLEQFIRARIAEAGFVGLLTWIGLSLINFPFAALVGLFTALANLIPYVGPIIGIIPALIIALINNYDMTQIVLVASVYGITQLLDIVFIIPLVVAKIMNLHPIAVVLSILVGAETMGVLGMIISIPVVSLLKVIFYSIHEHLDHLRL